MSLVYIYDEHLSVIKMYDTSHMGEATIDMKINEASTFYTKFEEQLPSNARYIAVQDPIANRRGMNDEFLLYRSHSNQLGDDGMYEYIWTEFAYDELSFDGYITDKRPNNITFRDVLALVLTGTKWKLGLTNIEGTTSVDFYYESPMDAIKKINEKFPAEFRFWVRLADDGTIVERIVDAVKKRGQNTGRRFETTSNVLSVTAQEDLSNIYSAIVPRGKGEQVSEGGDDGPDGYGRRITIKDVEWSKAKGDPVDKPLGQEWIALEQGETLVDGRLRYKIVVFENDTDINQLARDGYAQLLKDSVPKIQLSGNASDLGVSELGDTVQVVDKSKHIEYEARIFHITYDLLDHTNTKVEFGEDIISSNSISSKIDSITINQKNTQESINWAIQQADGKNTTYYGKNEPSVAVRDGDIWFREQDNGTTQMYRYEDGKWVSRDSMSPQRILENFYKNGELDAKRINVVNINASNIITGTLDATKVAIVGDKSRLDLAGDNLSIKSVDSSTPWSAIFDKDGMLLSKSNRSVGRIGVNELYQDFSKKGLYFGLESTGDFMAWGAQNYAGNPYSTKLSWFRAGAVPSNLPGLIEGFNFEDNVAFINPVEMRGGIKLQGANDRLLVRASNLNGGSYPTFGGPSAYFVYAGSDIYLSSNGTSINLTKIAKAFGGIRTAAIPTGFNSNGTATGWYNVDLS